MINIIIVILISLLYAAETVKAQTDSGGFPESSLQELLDTPICTAAKYEQKTFEAPASVTIITREEIERYGWRTLTEALNSIRGFYYRNDKNYDYIGLRGLNRPSDYNNKILLLIDGHTLNENLYAAGFFGTDLALDMNMIERVEIIRGPGSALYGSGAMLAVINVITKDYDDISGVKISGETGSFGRKQAAVRIGRGLSPNFNFSASAIIGEIEGQDYYFSEYDDPAANYGRAEEIDNDNYTGFNFKSQYKDLTLLGFYSSRLKQIPTGAFGVEFNNGSANSLDDRAYFESNYRKAITNRTQVLLRAFYDYYYYKGNYPYLIEESAGPLPLRILSEEYGVGNWAGGEAQVIYDFRPDNRMIFGTEFKYNFTAELKTWEADSVIFKDNFPYNIFSFYFQDTYQITRKFSAAAGFRSDYTTDEETTIVPRLALLYNPFENTALKLLYGEAFRSPNIYETQYSDPFLYKNNPGLKPEQIKTIELVWEQKINDWLYTAASLYRYDIRDLIDQVEVDTMLQFINFSGVDARGMEAELYARMPSGITWFCNGSLQSAVDQESKEKISNSPEYILKGGMTAPFFRHFCFAGEAHYEPGRKTDFDTKTGGIFLVNTNLRFRPMFTGSQGIMRTMNRLRIDFSVFNLFDVEYYHPAGLEHEMEDIIQNGREYTVRISLAL